MLKIIIIISYLSTSISLFSQINYKGYIDKYPIELITDVSADGDAKAIYTYKKYNDPMIINGRQSNDTLVLFEKNEYGKVSATLTFFNFDQKKKALNGIWKNLQTKQELNIKLNKDFEVEDGDSAEWQNREIIQPVSMTNYYFKLVLSKPKDEYYAKVTGVKVLQKKTDSLIQFITVDCQLLGFDNIEIDDYNFDGTKDFSIFESSHAGPNTTRVYFLYNPKTKKFFDAKFEGVSLEFDQKTKHISEQNQCCAGRQQTTAVYKVVNDKMILVEQHCYIWSDKRNELVERKMEDCQ